MGIVEQVGAEVANLGGRRPCRGALQHLLRALLDVRAGLQSQCETTQNHEQGTGASLFGYSKLYGRSPAARPSSCGCRSPTTAPIKVPEGPPDDRFVYLSDVLPTAWQAVEYAEVPRAADVCSSSGRAHRRHGDPDRAAPRRRM